VPEATPKEVRHVSTPWGDVTWLAIPFGVGGLIWGLVADRIAARWPAHEDGSVRGVDWRTPVVAVLAMAIVAVVPVRFEDSGQRLLFTAFFGASVLLLATDLDQRLMPDLITLPLIVVGLAALAWGGDMLVTKASPWVAIGAAVIVPLVLLALSLPFGAGAFGGGDVKFLMGVGLLIGAIRLVLAVFAAAILGAVVIIGLLAARRITLKSYVPFGPFLIAGAVCVTLIPSAAS
jgi:leader peptidase (prepilin peptidase)/N-methyltransferase